MLIPIKSRIIHLPFRIKHRYITLKFDFIDRPENRIPVLRYWWRTFWRLDPPLLKKKSYFQYCKEIWNW